MQISHCCIREMFKVMPDSVGQANGLKPPSLKSVGVSIIIFFPPCSENHTKCILNSQEYYGRGGGIYHSSLSAGKGPFEKDRG